MRARAQRQEWLFQAGHRFRVILWEAALRSLICPPAVLATQLDRLAGVIGLDTVELGIVPFSASVKIAPANGFWVLDDRLVIAEDWHAELWLTTPTVSLCTRRSEHPAGVRRVRRRRTQRDQRRAVRAQFEVTSSRDLAAARFACPTKIHARAAKNAVMTMSPTDSQCQLP